jgi:hypothetical protein
MFRLGGVGGEKDPRERTFYVKGSRKSYSVSTPTSTMGNKIVGLSGAGGDIRACEVVWTTNDAGFSGTAVSSLSSFNLHPLYDHRRRTYTEN